MTTGPAPKPRRFQAMSDEVKLGKQRRVLEAVADGAEESDAAYMASTTVATLRRWRDEEFEFDKAYSEAEEIGRIPEWWPVPDE